MDGTLPHLTEKWKQLQQLPGEVHPVRNSSRYDSKPSEVLDPATGGTAEQRGTISNGVVRPAAHLAGQSGVRVVD